MNSNRTESNYKFIYKKFSNISLLQHLHLNSLLFLKLPSTPLYPFRPNACILQKG